jgi:lysophospholipase L1-like esterase
MKKLNSAIAASILASMTIANAGAARTIVVFGDSISANNHEGQLLGAGYAEQSIFKGGKHTVIANVAEGGNTTAQLRARLASDVLSLDPDAVLLMAGTNSLLDGGGSDGIAACMADVEAMVVACLSAGVLPIIVTPPAKNVGITGTETVREAIRFYYTLAAHYGLPLIDLYKVSVDPLTGGYKAGFSTDGTHPAGAGITALSDYAGYVLANLGNFVAPAYLASVAVLYPTGANLLANGNFASAQYNTAFADGWNSNPNDATITLTPVTAGLVSGIPSHVNGKTVRYVIGNGNTGGRYVAIHDDVDPAYDTFEAGDTVIVAGRIKATLPAGAQGFSVSVQFGGVAGGPVNNVQQSGDFVFAQEMIVPATPGKLSVLVYGQDAGAVFELNNITVTNKTKDAAIWSPGKASV